MFIRASTIRRTLKPKLLVMSLVLVTFLFVIRSINNNSSSNSVNDVNAIGGGGGGGGVAPEEILNKNIQPEQLLVTKSGDSTTSNAKVDYEIMIRADIAKQRPGLGNEGESVILEGEAKVIGDRQLTKIALNEELSETLSYNRTVMDARNPLCRKQYHDIDELPTTSVVIIFYNEPYSVLLRTVHSVLNTVDKRILREIILVDDASTHVELLGKLDYYLETRLPKGAVKLIRLKSR